MNKSFIPVALMMAIVLTSFFSSPKFVQASIVADIQANGSDSPSPVTYQSQFTLSWEQSVTPFTFGTVTCSGAGDDVRTSSGASWSTMTNLPSSGSITLIAEKYGQGFSSPLSLSITCKRTFIGSVLETVSDSVSVPLTQTPGNPGSGGSGGSAGSGNVSGWAWSSNIGWIKFDHGQSNPVSINSNGNFAGFAWNSNIGWIDFSGVSLNNSTGAITGIARALSGGPDGTSTATDDGWDGQIKMSGTWQNGVKLIGNQISGFAWGDEVVGWVKFDQLFSGSGCTGVCVGGNNLSVSCQMPAAANVNEDVVITAITTGGDGNYTYVWNVGGTTDDNGQTSSPITVQFGTNGKYTASVGVTDSNGLTGSASCMTMAGSGGGDPDGDIDIGGGDGEFDLTVRIIGEGKVEDEGGQVLCESTSVDIKECENISLESDKDIILTGTPTNPADSVSWTGCVSQDGSECTINYPDGSNKTVIVTFGNGGVAPPNLIEITYPANPGVPVGVGSPKRIPITCSPVPANVNCANQFGLFDIENVSGEVINVSISGIQWTTGSQHPNTTLTSGGALEVGGTSSISLKFNNRVKTSELLGQITITAIGDSGAQEEEKIYIRYKDATLGESKKN